MKRFVDVYEDRRCAGDSIGVRDDGAIDVLSGDELAQWQAGASALGWLVPEEDHARRWRADCGKLLGRVEYDDGLPDTTCVPSP